MIISSNIPTFSPTGLPDMDYMTANRTVCAFEGKYSSNVKMLDLIPFVWGLPHGGKLEVESEPDQGAAFHLTLSLQSAL